MSKKIHPAAELAAYKTGLLKSPAAEEDEEKYIRLAAEFDNFRKRSARQYAEIIKNANEELILELLGILDDFQRALEESTAALEGLPNDGEIVARIGYAHRRLGNWSEVFEAFQQATKLNPRNANLFYDLGGHSYGAARRYADAVWAYDRALQT